MIDITTTTRVQNIIKSSSLPTVDGNLIADMIDGLTPVAERWLGRKLQKTAYTQQMDVRRGQSVFQLDAYPVETSPALALRNDLGRDFTGTAIDADNYYLDLERGTITFDKSYLVWGPGVLQAIWTGGMASSTTILVSSSAFEGIVLGADLQIAHVFQRRHEVGATSFAAEGGSIAAARSFGRLCEATIDLWTPYRRVGRRR